MFVLDLGPFGVPFFISTTRKTRQISYLPLSDLLNTLLEKIDTWIEMTSIQTTHKDTKNDYEDENLPLKNQPIFGNVGLPSDLQHRREHNDW